MRWWIAAAAAAWFLYFYQLTGMGMVGPDEPRYAWIGREMARSGDWVTPRLWGDPWFEKPALLYWMTAAAFRLGFGDDAAPRLPVAFVSVAFLSFFWWRMKAEFGPAAARYGVMVLATSAGWVAYSHAAVFDLPLSATFGAAMLCLLSWMERRNPRWLLTGAGLLGLSALAKGLVGPVLAGLTVLVWIAMQRNREMLRGLLRPAPVLIFLAVATPWYAWCSLRNGAVFLEDFFWKHHVTRYAAGALEHNQPVWYYLPVMAVGLLPWTPLYAAVRRLEPRSVFLFCWAAVTVVFFSLSRDKLPAYVLPAFPALAALGGVVLAEAARPMKMLLPLCAATLALMPAAAAVLPQALDTGLSRAISEVRFPAASLAAVAGLAGGVWFAERAGRRLLAVALVAAGSVAGYATIKYTAFPAIDREAGVRALWQEVRPHAQEVCLGEVRRHVEYGLNYYAGRKLPRCGDHPQPFRVEGREVVLLMKP